MGLAASQARLLTVTARKSDCEFQSMRYSHEKLALSRNMTDVSNEYQNALNKTKLVYDYYGKGDTTTPLSYGLLMTPSQLNGYMPTLVTDQPGRAVLNSQYAQAARAAGIPQQGLGSLPSTDVRNRFIQGLAGAGLITQEMAKTCQGIQYSQEIGNGASDYVTTKMKEISVKDLAAMIDANGFSINLMGSGFEQDSESKIAVNGESHDLDQFYNSGNKITMSDLFSKDYSIYATREDEDGRFARFEEQAVEISQLSCWEDMIEAFSKSLDNGTDAARKAIEYATVKTRQLLYFKNTDYSHDLRIDNKQAIMERPGIEDACNNWGGFEEGYEWLEESGDAENVMGANTNKYIGYYGADSRNTASYNQFDGVGISISNIAKAFLTYFAEAMNGKTGQYKVSDQFATANGGRDDHNRYDNRVDGSRSIENSSLVGASSDYKFSVVDSKDINSDQALISGFYDALFNQICLKGWVENNNVMDNGYMQEMLQNGMLFLATMADDNYYYQGNYATNTFIKEITDEEAITKAEAKYNTEKQKVNNKEQVIDLKMKNLDTEISSLTTEYDTVKSVISKNIEKAFKRYDA